MKLKVSTVVGVLIIGILSSGCSYKRSGTAGLTKLDGTQVDYANMSKYKKVETCMKPQSREDSSLSVFDAAKKAGIKNIVYVDKSYTQTELCVIVYGE